MTRDAIDSSRGARLRYFRDLVLSLAWEDIKVRYKSPVLGFLWSLVMPLVLVVIFSFVFSQIIQIDLQPYPLYLLMGLFPWNFLSLSLSTGTTAFVSNGPLIKNIAFPRLAIPTAIVLTQLAHFLVALLLLLASCLLLGIPCTARWLALPLVIAIQALFVWGLLLLCAALHVYFRDMKYLVEVVLVAWFYLTPIFYSPTMMPDAVRPMLLLNPMALLATLYRLLLLGHDESWWSRLLGTPYTWQALAAYAALLSGVCAQVGWLVFRRLAGRFADRV